MNQALSGLHTEKMESLGKAMESLGKVGNIKIPASVPKRISEIGTAMKSINQSDIDRMESLSRALQGIHSVQNINIPRVNVPTGLGVGTPNPADINTTPATSGRTTSQSGTQTEDVNSTGGADNGMSHADSELQNVTSNAVSTREALSGLKKELFDFKGITGISYIGDQFSELKNKISAIPQKISQTIGNLAQMTQQFKKSGGILGAFGRTIKSVATSLGSKLAAGMKQVTSAFGNAFTSKVHNATSALGSFLASIKRIALYRMIRFAMSQLTQCFKDGINNLYNYSALMGGTFANSMNSLATNAQYLKNSIEYSVKTGLFDPIGEMQKAFVTRERLIELLKNRFSFAIWSARWINYSEYKINVGELPIL